MQKITTILPTYKRPALLMRAINSVRMQTWKDIKIVVRDNFSEDITEQLVTNLAKIDSRVTYIRNKKNIGAFENFKQGLENVETDFFSILSDDDYLEPEFYAEAMRLFEQYPDSGFVAMEVNTVNLDGNLLNLDIKKSSLTAQGCLIHSKYFNSENGIDGYLKGVFPYTWTAYVFRKNVISAIGFPEFSDVGFGSDILFIWHAAARFSFVTSSFIGANFTAHSNSTSSTLVNPFDERFLYWWRNRMLIIKNDPHVSDEVKAKISKHYLTHSTKSFNNFKYYFRSAVLLILDRVKKKQFEELKFDFISMRSFLPWIVLIGIKFTIITLVFLKLDDKLRTLIRSIKSLMKSLQ